MANDKTFKVKNGLLAQRYLQSAGTETAGAVGYASVSGWSYSNKSFSVTSQETLPHGVFFSSDGTKAYVVGTASDTVYQYSLSTAWDISTASYTSVSFSVASQDGSPLDITFKPDGTKMYITGVDNDRVYQYTLSTAWDLSTASYDSVSFYVGTQDGYPSSTEFKPDGTVMYVMGGNVRIVYQYTLSTAWDISTASYASISFNVGTQDTQPFHILLNGSGTKMYMLGLTNQSVFQYSLSTAWNIGTATYDSLSFSVGTQELYARSMSFGSSGTILYILGTNTDTIYQYSSASYTQTLDLSTGTYFSFTPSGATTISFTNPPASGLAIGFAVEINGNGSAITWPTSVKWHEATAPTATASKEIYTFITTDGGTTYYGKQAATELA